MGMSPEQNGLSVHQEKSTFGSFLDTSRAVAYNGQFLITLKQKKASTSSVKV